MKKLLIAIGLFLSLGAVGQSIDQKLGAPNVNSHYLGYLQSDSGLYIAYRDTTFAPAHMPCVVVRPQDGIAYLWNGTSWGLLGAPVWGKIKGSIVNQSDLMDSLNNRQGMLIPAYGIRVSNDSVSIDSAHVPLVHNVYRISDSTIGVLVNGVIDTVLVRGTAAGGIGSLVDTVPSILFISPVVYTNTGGAWRARTQLKLQNPNTFLAGDSIGSSDTPRFRHLALADLPTAIPNSNLANASISFSIDNIGSSPAWSNSGNVNLGASITLHLPVASATTSGILTASDWARFNSLSSPPVTSVNGQVGIVNVANADSLRGYPIDFTNFHDNWLLAGDSTNNKMKFVSPATAGFDSLFSQGGGFHTQPYNDVRYFKRGDTTFNNPGNAVTQASRQKLSDSLTFNISKKQTDLIWLPITYYNAIADSGTTDNTAAVQSCVDSITRSTKKKGVVYIPAGVWGLNGTIHIPAGTQITFLGAGGSVGEISNAISKLVTNRTTGDVIVDSANNSIFQGFDIQNNAATPTAGAGIHMVGWFAKISQMAIANFYYDVELDNSLYDYVSKVSLLEAVQYSLYDNNNPLPDWGDATIDGCIFQSGTGPVQHATVAAIYFPNSGGPKIFGCKFNGSSSGIQTCIRGNLVGSGNSTSDLLINGNSFEGFSKYAMWITCPGANFSNIVFTGNEVAGFGSSGNGILLDGTSGGLHRVSIAGNTFNSVDSAIQAYHVDQLKISANSIDSPSTVSYKFVTTFCTNCAFDDWNAGGTVGVSDSGFAVQIGPNTSAVPLQKYTVGSARFIRGDTSQTNPGAIVTQASRKKLSDSLAGVVQTNLNDSMASIRTATSIYPRQGLSPYGSPTTDTIALGGIAGAFIGPDTIYTNHQPLLITGLPSKSSAGATDSAVASDINNQLWKVPFPSGGSSLPSQTGNGGKFLRTNGTTNYWALPFRWIYLDSAAGAPGDSATDESAVFQNAVDTCASWGGCKILVGPGIHLIKRALQTTKNGKAVNCQICIPLNDSTSGANAISIDIEGDYMPSWEQAIAIPGWVTPRKSPTIESTIVGTYNGTIPPSVIGSPGNTLHGETWNATDLYMTDIIVRTNNLGTTGADTVLTMSGIDANQLANFNAGYLRIDQTSGNLYAMARPASGTFGLRTPANDNSAVCNIYYLMSSGFDAGVIANEHLDVTKSFFPGDDTAVIVNNTTYDIHFGRMLVQGCPWGIFSKATSGYIPLWIEQYTNEHLDTTFHAANWNYQGDAISNCYSCLVGSVQYVIGDINSGFNGINNGKFLSRNIRQDLFHMTPFGQMGTNPLQAFDYTNTNNVINIGQGNGEAPSICYGCRFGITSSVDTATINGYVFQVRQTNSGPQWYYMASATVGSAITWTLYMNLALSTGHLQTVNGIDLGSSGGTTFGDDNTYGILSSSGFTKVKGGSGVAKTSWANTTIQHVIGSGGAYYINYGETTRTGGGTTIFNIDGTSGNAYYGGNTQGTARLNVGPSTTSLSAFRIYPSSSVPTSPNDGESYNNNLTHHWMYYTNGNWYNLDQQTFQQSLTASSTLTGSNTVTNTGNTFTWLNGGTGLFKWSGLSHDTTNTFGLLGMANDSSTRAFSWQNAAGKLAPFLSTGSYYQTVQSAGTGKTQRANLNILAPLTATDNSGNNSTDIGLGSLTQIPTTGSVPTSAAGGAEPCGSGTGCSFSFITGSNSVAGLWTITTGGAASPTDDVIATITLPVAQPNNLYKILLTPYGNSGYGFVNAMAFAISTTQFQITLAPGQTMATSTSYGWYYLIVN